MSSKKSFEFFDGAFYSPLNVIAAIKSGARDYTDAGKNVRLHLHIAGSTAKGKTYLSFFIANAVAAIFESEDNDLKIKVLSFEKFKRDAGDIDADSIALSQYFDRGFAADKNLGDEVSILITEGQVGNEIECYSKIASSGYFDLSVCCIVEPSVGTFASINRAKCKSEQNVSPKWMERYKEMSKMGISEAIDRLYIETVDSHRFWSEVCPCVITVSNHASRAILTPKFEDQLNDSSLSLVY